MTNAPPVKIEYVPEKKKHNFARELDESIPELIVPEKKSVWSTLLGWFKGERR